MWEFGTSTRMDRQIRVSSFAGWLENGLGDCQTVHMRLGDFEIAEPVPELKDPHVLAVLRPWVDVGNVGTLSLSRVERHLHAREAGRLVRPGRFYDFTRYRPRSYLNHGEREFSIPNSVIRYATQEEGPDLILLHLLEPHVYGEDYVESVVEVLKYFQIKRYCTIGAMYDMVPHTRPLLVSGSGSELGSENKSHLPPPRPSKYEGPTSITYLISIQTREMEIETRSFLVHLPQYFQVEEDFTGTARLMEILCNLYHWPKRLMDEERGRQQYDALRNIVGEASEVSSLLERLEERYDKEQQGETVPPPLSPNIEQFLRKLDRDFESPE